MHADGLTQSVAAEQATGAGALPNPLVSGLEHSPVDPTTMVIFGATGDLAHRKLLPAIYNLAHEGALPERFNLVGFAFEEYDDESFRKMMGESIEQYSRRAPKPEVLEALLHRTQYVQGSFAELPDFERLPVHPTTMVIFGATGDLSKRKLLPAIYNLAHEGALPEQFNLIGVSRGEMSDDEFRKTARESISEFSRREADEKVLDELTLLKDVTIQ